MYVRRSFAVVLLCPLVAATGGCGARQRTKISTTGQGSNGASTAPAIGAAPLPGPAAGTEAEQQRTADLQAQLAERDQQIAALQTQVQDLRDGEAALRTSLQRATEAADATAAAAAGPESGAEPSPVGDEPAAAGGKLASTPSSRTPTVAALQAQLHAERARRQRAETELARLKEETSSPPFGEPDSPPEVANAQEEVVALRTALADEREARAKLAAQFDELERRAVAEHAPDPQDQDLRWRLESLQSEKEAVVDSFTRSLAASQQRTAELEQQLVLRQQTDATASALQTENTLLHAQLDEEHRRTEALANKLKVAARVTELIFKMQTQQRSAAAAPPSGPAGDAPLVEAP